MGQQNENDNNKNRKYPIIDQRIKDSYAKASKASNKNALSDAYVKFFRWAADRLQGRDGIICFVSNNGFLNGIAFDGFRKTLLQDFTQIYHLDLKGNARTSGVRRQAEGGNVFDDKIRTGIGITLLVKSNRHTTRSVWYYGVENYLKAEEKLEFLRDHQSIGLVSWEEMIVDSKHNWLVEALNSDFATFLPIGDKATKSTHTDRISALFKTYSRGAETTRDNWMYDFDKNHLVSKTKSMIETYNSELSRWIRAGSPKDVDSFVLSDETKIKWSSRLKECLMRKIEARFKGSSVRKALYRPFTPQWLYFDNVMTHRQGCFLRSFLQPSVNKKIE